MLAEPKEELEWVFVGELVAELLREVFWSRYGELLVELVHKLGGGVPVWQVLVEL